MQPVSVGVTSVNVSCKSQEDTDIDSEEAAERGGDVSAVSVGLKRVNVCWGIVLQWRLA